MPELLPISIRAYQTDGSQVYIDDPAAYWLLWHEGLDRPYDTRRFATFAEAQAALRALRER